MYELFPQVWSLGGVLPAVGARNAEQRSACDLMLPTSAGRFSPPPAP